MNILFVHQNFPGQFKHLAPALARGGHAVSALCIDGPGLPDIQVHRYRPQRGSSRDIHPWVADFETKVLRGEACAAAAARLHAEGFRPDVIVSNPGWGESLFLKDVWPQARVLELLEFYYAAQGLDFDFDPEFAAPGVAGAARLRAKNAHLLLAMAAMDAGISPTHFQRSTLPAAYRDRVSVIFDGIDTQSVRPDASVHAVVGTRTLRVGDEIITFVNRNLEPMRGYHIFMRALPRILRERPNAVALIVGADGVSYGAKPPPQTDEATTWKQIFLNQVKPELDLTRVHFLGRLAYADYLKALQLSSCHVYLTYPFVLGWSCIEAMSVGCVVVGSATPPVREVIEHGKNGLLTDFFDVQALAQCAIDVLAHPERYRQLRDAARQTVIKRYDLESICLPRQTALVTGLAGA